MIEHGHNLRASVCPHGIVLMSPSAAPWFRTARTTYMRGTRVPGAFERLTPPWERVEIVERSGGLEDGARTVVRVRAGPASLRWVAVHRDHVPGRRFVDEQVEGPFAHWVHRHEFAPEGAGARITDRIEYAPPYGLAGAAADLWLVRPKINRLLAYRHALLQDDLAAHARFAAQPRLRVAITGATGLIGQALTAFLTTGGHQVTRIVRSAPGPGRRALGSCPRRDRSRRRSRSWTPWSTWQARTSRRGDGRRSGSAASVTAEWPPPRSSPRRSRGSPRPPKVLVSASAVGIYGPRGDEVLTEASAPGPDGNFFVDVARDWEAAADPARRAGIRVAQPRFGVVLSPRGGALGKAPPAVSRRCRRPARRRPACG